MTTAFTKHKLLVAGHVFSVLPGGTKNPAGGFFCFKIGWLWQQGRKPSLFLKICEYCNGNSKNDHHLVFYFSVWPALCSDDAGTMKQQMPLISCHYSSVASHKHIPTLSRRRSQVQRYHLPCCVHEWMCVWQRVINKEIKDKNGTRRLRMHVRMSQNKVSVSGREQRGSQPTLTCFLSVHWVHKFRLDDTVRPSRQTESLQDRSRRLKRDSWLWCQLFSLVTGEHDGQLDCCSAQYLSFFSLAAQTAALSWFDWRTSVHLILLFMRLVL